MHQSLHDIQDITYLQYLVLMLQAMSSTAFGASTAVPNAVKLEPLPAVQTKAKQVNQLRQCRLCWSGLDLTLPVLHCIKMMLQLHVCSVRLDYDQLLAVMTATIRAVTFLRPYQCGTVVCV